MFVHVSFPSKAEGEEVGNAGAGHMDNTGKKYYMTATVGCAYPDPSLGGVLGQNGNLFDYIAIRYFNDYNCAGSAELIDFSFTKRWAPL